MISASAFPLLCSAIVGVVGDAEAGAAGLAAVGVAAVVWFVKRRPPDATIADPLLSGQRDVTSRVV